MESYFEEFVRVVEAGSVSAAARQLGVPRASVSRRLARLEKGLGVQLLHRETHRQTLTEAGHELYRRARRIVAAMLDARRAVSQMDAVPRGVLRFGMPRWAMVAATLTRAFRDLYPKVEVEIVTANVHSDLLADHIDVALTAGRVRDERLVARKLFAANTLVYGAPSLLQGRVPTIDTLTDFPCIVGFDASGRPETEWPLWSGGTVPVGGPVRMDTVEGQIEGAVLGLGLALGPEPGVREHVRSGALVSVLTEHVGASTPVSLAWPRMDYVDPKVRAFVDMAADLVVDMVRRQHG